MNNNESTIYNIQINKNKLKSIRKKVIRKYGHCSNTVYISSKKDFYENVTNEITNTTYINFKDMGKSVSFKKVTNPVLAVFISQILNGNNDLIFKISNLEDMNILGREYLELIKNNIKIEKKEKEFVKKYIYSTNS